VEVEDSIPFETYFITETQKDETVTQKRRVCEYTIAGIFRFIFDLLTRCNFLPEVKAIPVTGHGGPYGCETSMLPHFLDNRITDGGEVVSLTLRPPFTPRKIPGSHFY
jgi:hypothetical protein